MPLVGAEAAARRYFVGIGVGDYDEPTLDLARAIDDVDNVSRWFVSESGVTYERALTDLSINPARPEIETGLNEFLRSVAPDDVVIVWFACHGEIEGASSYLLGRDARPDNLLGTAVAAHTVGAMLGQGRSHNVLVVVDACVAGDLADEIDVVMRNEIRARHSRDPHRGYVHAIVSSTYGRNPAFDGRFAEAFLRAVSLEKWTGAVHRWLSIDSVMQAIRSELRDISPTQVASQSVSATGENHLIPNPNFERRALVGLIADDEFAAHFDPASRGVVAGESGSYFTGRIEELRTIRTWLAPRDDDPEPSGLRVITGAPGTGKSALLSRVVVLSDVSTRPQDDALQALPADSIPPPGAFNGVVWCHNKTATAVIQELGTILGGPAQSAPDLLELAARRTSCAIAIDALDEATGDGARLLAEEVLAPLARSPGIRLLVGTRPQAVHAAGDRTGLLGRLGVREDETIDLDESADLDDDMRAYVSKRLTAGGHPAPGDLAAAITAAARPSFLVAAIAAQSALTERAERPSVDGREDVSRYRLPTDVGEALDQYIERLSDPARARILLTPLAWAGGAGMPWGQWWPMLATAIAKAADEGADDVTDDHIDDLLSEAGDLVVETAAEGGSLYRLFHEALAEHLRRHSGPPEIVHAAIADAMTAAVEGTDWVDVDPYVIAQLPQHLAAAGRFDEAVAILCDPRWDRARRTSADHPLAAVIDAAAVIQSVLATEPDNLRAIHALCHCHSRAVTTGPPLIIDVIARSGQTTRARLMANNLTIGSDRMVAFALLATTFAEAGWHDDAVSAVGEVERAIRALPESHVPMGWFWVTRAAIAARLDETATRAARASFTAAAVLGGDGWDVPNGLFWAGAAARLAGDVDLLGEIGDEFTRRDPVHFRNQALQAAAVTGRRDFLEPCFDDYIVDLQPGGPIRAGNLALALVDADMTEQADRLFDSLDRPTYGEDDSLKRWAWALAKSGRIDRALRDLPLIQAPHERSKAIERVLDIAAANSDRPALDELRAAIEPLLSDSEPRTRARMVRCLWLTGDEDRAQELAEHEISISHQKGWMLDPRDSSAPPAVVGGAKSGRRQMATSMTLVEDAQTLAAVEGAARAGDLDTARTGLASMTVPLYRAQAGEAIAVNEADATRATRTWLRSLDDARLAGRNVVDILGRSGRAVFERAGRADEFAAAQEAQRALDARWELEAFAEQYVAVRRAMPPGSSRTGRMQSLMNTPRRLARLHLLTRTDLEEAWATGDHGRRLFVLGLMTGDPDLADAAILVDGIRASRSAFEQREALSAAMTAALDPTDVARVAAAAAAELAGDPRPDGVVSDLAEDGERHDLATRLVGSRRQM